MIITFPPGVNVLLNVDATQLSKDSRLTDIKFTKFIFNFPHTGGKMKINLNRELIRLFCEECKHMIVGSDKDFTNLCCSKRDYYRDCEILIPLCKGQGGTKYDETRTWEDTWKLVEMCGYADLVLSNVEYFDTTMLKFYSSIGFRSREQHFNTVKGIIHVLKLSLHPELNKYTSWVDMYPDLDIGHLMDMKQTSILTNSIFSCFKCLFIEAIDLSKAPSGKLQLENTFIIRHGFSSSKPQYPPLDPSKIYDYRIFCNPLKTNSFKIHPVEYNYISENLGFKPLCLSFVRDVCSKINETSNLIGTRLPIEVITSNTKEPVTQHFLVITNDQVGTIAIQNCVNNEIEIVFDNYVEDKTSGSINTIRNENETTQIFFFQKFVQFLSCSKNWRVIFSHENFICIENESLMFHFAHLSPIEYRFDINFTVQTSDYTHEKFFSCLWYIIPEMIQGVQLINEHQSPNQQYKSYLFRIWYKSYDRPMYRKKVIDIHQNVIGKCLNSMLGVKID